MERPAVISISSHVARGSVGNRAVVFALETMGFPVWSVPTVTLPWHPGHGPSSKLVPEPDAFEAFVQDIGKAPWIGEVGAVLTGYMANVAQVESVSGLIGKLRQANPGLYYACDPVIGDTTGLYVNEKIATAIRDKLIPHCDIATPNRYELAWLLNGEVPETVSEVTALADRFEPPSALVTSSPGESAGVTGNLYHDQTETLFAYHKELDNPPNGTGDLTAALFLANLLSGRSSKENLQQTTGTVFEVLQNAIQCGSDELNLETDRASLLDPKVRVEMRKL